MHYAVHRVLFRESIFSVYAVVIPVRPLFATSSLAHQTAGTHSDTVIGTALRRACGASCIWLTLILKGVDRTSNSRSAWGPAGAPLTLKELREDMVALLVYVQVLFKWTDRDDFGIIISCTGSGGGALRTISARWPAPSVFSHLKRHPSGILLYV